MELAIKLALPIKMLIGETDPTLTLVGHPPLLHTPISRSRPDSRVWTSVIWCQTTRTLHCSTGTRPTRSLILMPKCRCDIYDRPFLPAALTRHETGGIRR